MSPIDPRIPLGVQPPQIQSPLDVYSAVSQIQEQRERTEARRLAAEEKRHEVAQKQALEQALQASIIIDPKTKRITFDRAALLANAPASVAYKLQRELDDDEVSANKLAESLLDLEGKKRDYRGSISRTIRAAGYNPDVFQRLMHGAQGFGAIDDETAAQYASLGDTGQIQSIVDDYIAQTGGEAAKLQKVTKYDPATGQTVETFVTPTEGAEFVQPPPKAPTPAFQQKDVLLDWKPAIVNFDPHSGKSFVGDQDVTARVRPIPPQGPGPEPLVQVMENGVPVWRTRSQAVGQPAGGGTAGRPPTEGERKAAGFHGQMQQALTTINQLESQLTEGDLYQIQSLPQEGITGAINRGLMSDAAKRYIQAFNQFTEARLRPVSGAAIAASEYERDRATYGKQYAETPALAAQRLAARQQALESLGAMAGSALAETTEDTTAGLPPPRTTKKNPFVK